MMYQDADDYGLEQDMVFDLNEAETAESSDNVTVVSQFDRYDGTYDGDGDWTGTRRYLLSSDSNLEEISSLLVQDMGELNMSDGRTLSDFYLGD